MRLRRTVYFLFPFATVGFLSGPYAFLAGAGVKLMKFTITRIAVASDLDMPVRGFVIPAAGIRD